MKKLLAASAAVGLGAVFALTSPAFATGHDWKQPKPYNKCVTTIHTNANGILLTSNGEAGGPATSATATVQSIGVELDLHNDALGKTLWLTNPSKNPTLVSEIASLSYSTWQLNASSVALPSWQIQIDRNGGVLEAGDFTTLVYEPYMQSGFANTMGSWQNWDSIKGGNALWWSSKPLTLLPDNADQGHPQKWSDIQVKYPNATVLLYGFNLGKGSPAAHARIDKLKFATVDRCNQHDWKLEDKPSPRPSKSVTTSPSPSKSVSPSVSVSPSASTSVSASMTTSPSASASTAVVVPVGNSSPTLPVTGSSVPIILITGSLLTLFGVGLLVWSRKRKNNVEFVTE